MFVTSIFIVGKLEITFTTATATASVVMRSVKTIAEKMTSWCNEHSVAFTRDYLIDSARALSAGEPADILTERDGQINLLSFYSGNVQADLLVIFLCSHAKRLRECNPIHKIYVTYIVNCMPREPVIEWAAEQGVSFCLSQNAIDRMESLLL